MFTVFRKTKALRIEPRPVLLKFAYAPIAVGLIAALLGFGVALEKRGIDDGNFWTAISMSVGIFIAGICILIYSLRQKSNGDEAENTDVAP